MSIVVNTPHSHIGRIIVDQLLAAGAAVTVISRDAERAAPLAARGARVVIGSIDDPATLDAAFEGADQLFWLTPPHFVPHQAQYIAGLADLLNSKARGLRRVVVLSSTGAHNRDTEGHLGPVGLLLTIEEAFRAAVPHVLALRPAFFMENLLRDLPTLQGPGALFTVAPIDAPFPMVATQDIGQRAAEALLDPSWSGHQYRGVHGPHDITYRQIADAISAAIGRPIQAIQVTLDQAKAGMAQAGLPPFVVELYGNLYAGFIDGRLAPAEPRDAFSTTATDIETFAREVLAPAFHAG